MMATLERGSEKLTELFTVGLKNAHALEKQAISIMTPQVARLDHYPELRDRLREHIDETNSQIARLDQLLDGMGTNASFLKDTATSLTGGAAAIAHSVFGDEVLKNSYANQAFENFEIASYKSLIVMGDDLGMRDATSLLGETLREEQSMAQWLDESLPMVTRRYMQLYADEGSLQAKV